MSSNEPHDNNKHRSKNRSHRRRGNNKHNHKEQEDASSNNNTTTSCDDHHSVSTISDNEHHHHHQQQQQSTVQPTAATESPIVQVQVEEEEQEATKTPSAPVSVVRVPSSNSSTGEEVHDDNTAAVRSMPPPSASVDTIHPQSPKKQEESCSSECQVKRAIHWAQEKRLLKILLEVFILLRAVCFFAFAVCLSVALGAQRRVLVRFPKAKTYTDRIESIVVPLLKSADERLKVTKTVIPTVVSYSTKALDAVEKFAAECEAQDLSKLCAVVRRTPSDVEGEFRWTSSHA